MSASAGIARAMVLEAPRTFREREFDIAPVGPRDGLLRVEAVGICGSDYGQFQGDMGGLGTPFPLIPGHEIIGRIERVGEDAERRWGVSPGDRVAVEAQVPCGTCPRCLRGRYPHCPNKRSYGLFTSCSVPPHLWGGYSTHIHLHPNTLIHRIPETIPLHQAPFYTAMSNGVRWAYEIPQTRVGETVVILGPGQQGLACVVGALEAGAATVIIVGTEGDAERLAVAQGLGATHAVLAQGAVAAVEEITEGRMADVAVEASGADGAQAMLPDLVGVDGRIVLAGLGPPRHSLPWNPGDLIKREITVRGAFAHTYGTSATALQIMASGRYDLEPLCTHVFALADAERAVRLVGREWRDDREPIHVVLLPDGEA